ncbi:aminotransferase DegT [Desulfosarcina ovata subsp. sediminis]|uniref:Aminotransferase DegT n=1 Tax=Desulfosarcina ovata subsp. sediminis TaxID=885957 RepID=A0A5K7ZRE2_9BACT|nr:DegT/DnrJ/EryC1/StrS family aminotransferase [Desulfosarcina ovata]BBO81313.1 aminotransferase DegT [Desulfosarcina ovata subsp. sediminis]
MTTKPFERPVYVTQPFLPDFNNFCDCLKEIWDNHWLTNNGPIVQRYAERLGRYFETNNVCLFTNGTLALQIALQGMDISGEVITTPFTFVATTHALYWNKIRPVFVDIEPDYYTLDPEKVEAAITPWTTAILAVHVFGHPCKLNELSDIARKHNLKLIYDAAHAFGVKIEGKSIAHCGDLSMYSFHATKLYHSIEGGALIFRDSGLKKKFDYLKNFGFENEIEVVMPGTNAKMNEFQALMGELILNQIDDLISHRRKLYETYYHRLSDIPGIHMASCFSSDINYNYAYIPIEIDAGGFGISRDKLYDELKKYNIFTRRYFYPLICNYSCYRSVSVTDPLKVAKSVSSRILTLPIYSQLRIEDVEKICLIIEHIQKKS